MGTPLRANLLWECSAGGAFGLKDGELTLAAILDLVNSSSEAEVAPPDDFLYYYLPRLFGAAAIKLELCGGRVYQGIQQPPDRIYS